jgi:hypothetical protein
LDGTDAMIHLSEWTGAPPEAMTGTKIVDWIASNCPSKNKNKNNQTEKKVPQKETIFGSFLKC